MAVVLDLYSRRVVGWSMQKTMTSQLVADAIVMAIWRRGNPRQLLHHSDQPSTPANTFRELLNEHGITCSMSRAGKVWDNAAMESFFSSLKTERVARKVYRTRSQARADVFDYIEVFYNPTRRHSTLGYVSPGTLPIGVPFSCQFSASALPATEMINKTPTGVNSTFRNDA